MHLFSTRKNTNLESSSHNRKHSLKNMHPIQSIEAVRIDFLKPIAYSLIGLFFILNLISLTNFPLVHSDEIWLKGLSLEVWHQKNFGVTEPFFDLYPRVQHPFRWIFNLLQLSFMGLFGNSVFSVRLLSLVASTLSLLIFFKILRHETQSKNKVKITPKINALCHYRLVTAHAQYSVAICHTLWTSRSAHHALYVTQLLALHPPKKAQITCFDRPIRHWYSSQ